MSTVKHLSFAGITLPLATPELEEWLKQVHPQSTFQDFSSWNFDGFDLKNLPTPPLPRIPEFQLGVLHWPTGASRPAWFHAVVNGTILNQIRTAVGDPMTPKPLVMYDGRTNQTITAQMYLLPARPLNQLGHDISDGYVLTLTDQRFFWPWRRGVISTQPVSWTNLYNSLSNILGVPITVDTVSSAYATPSKKWIGYYRPTPAVLDSVATQIGQRIVCGLDGTVRTVNWPTAKGSSDAQRLVFTHKVSGGFIPTQPDIARYVPSSVRILFASGSGQFFFASGGCCSEITAPYTVDKFLFPLQVPGYGTASGFPYASVVVFGDLPFDGTNAAAVGNYATEAANAWYGWRSEEPEIVYPGIETWQPTGWEDYVEWTIQKREDQPFATTMVRRNEWNEFVSGSWAAGLVQQTAPSPPSPPVTSNGFFARLTAVSSGKWKYQPLTLNSSGVYVDDGAASPSFTASPLTIDGVTTCNPVVGLRVWMIQSKQSGLQEFLPVGYTDYTHPGLINLSNQQLGKGVKTAQQLAVNPDPTSYGSVFIASSGIPDIQFWQTDPGTLTPNGNSADSVVYGGTLVMGGGSGFTVNFGGGNFAGRINAIRTVHVYHDATTPLTVELDSLISPTGYAGPGLFFINGLPFMSLIFDSTVTGGPYVVLTDSNLTVASTTKFLVDGICYSIASGTGIHDGISNTLYANPVAEGGIIVNRGTKLSAITSLTDSTTGTIGNTISDVGTTFSQATLNNNFASVTDRINTILARLRSANTIS